MDNLTHALLGAGLAGSGSVRPEHRRGIWLAVMSGSQAPDLDLLPGFLNPQAQLEFHRGYSHSWLGLAIIVGILTLTIGVVEPRVPRIKVCGWTALAAGIHLIFDALTSYGTGIFLPFAERSAALDVLFNVDLAILIILATGLFFCFRGKRQAMLAAMLLVLVYTGSRYALHINLCRAAEKTINCKRYSIVPGLNPFGKWILVVDKENNYSLGKISPISGKIMLIKDYPKNLEHPLVVKVAQNPVIESYLKAARHPYAEITWEEGLCKIRFSDLRLWPYSGFNAIVYLDKAEVKKVKLTPRI